MEAKNIIDFDDFDTEENPSTVLSDHEFVKFLIDNNAYNSFIENLKQESINPDSLYFRRWWYSVDTFCRDIGNPHYYFNCAFTWSDYPEGKTFWARLNNTWVICNKYD